MCSSDLWVYRDEDIYSLEQARLFRGATWNFVGLEAEVPTPGDYKTAFVGDMPVVVARDLEGTLRVWENRCAHRGALLVLENQGHAKDIACVYHNWTYNLKGELTGVAFRKGIHGKGGMPADARPESQAPMQLRVATYHGLVFATCSDATPPIEDYLGANIAERVRRVMKEPVKVLGSYSQILNNNWKLYMDNVKDTYHASLLHLFFTKFRINRLEMKGGVIVGGDGGNHVSYNMMNAGNQHSEYEKAGVRTASGGHQLEIGRAHV